MPIAVEDTGYRDTGYVSHKIAGDSTAKSEK